METAQQDLKEIHTSTVDNDTSVNARLSAHHISSKKQLICHRCLGTGHLPAVCRFKSAKCHETGHIAKACVTMESSKQATRRANTQNEHQNTNRRQQQHHKKKSANTQQIVQESSSDSEIVDIVHVHTMSSEIPKSYKVLTKVNDIPITMELDIGAGVSIVCEQTWSDKLKSPHLQSCSLKLPSKPLDVLGSCTVKVTVHGKTASLPLVVVKGDGISLLGRNWLEKIKLDWKEVAKINGITQLTHQKKLDNLLTQYEEIFKDELGQCKQIKAKLHVKPEAVPKFYRPRPIPLAMIEKVEEDLERLEKRSNL